MAQAVTEQVLYRVGDGIAHITLNRPAHRNALSVDMCNRLCDLWDAIDSDRQVRVVILDGADCGTFCAGMDLKEAATIRRTTGLDIRDRLVDPYFERMRRVSKPIIVAITGNFTAAGMVLAVNADLRIGLANTQGGIAEAKWGRGLSWAVPLAWMLPFGKGLEMVMTGEFVDIEQLRQFGFINHVEQTPDEVRHRAKTMATAIRDNAPLSVMAAKQSLLRTLDLGCRAGFAAAKDIHEPVYASQDAQEGPRAFSEKRAPVWLGR